MEQITIEEALGKRLERVWHEYDEVVLFFDDETWAHCQGDDRIKFPSLGELACSDMRDAGIITEEAYQAILQEKDAERANEREQRERKEYERLRAKFEEKI